MRRMKNSKLIAETILAAAFVVVPLAGRAADTGSSASTEAKPKPDMLTTCPVSGDKLGEMGKPYVFVYKGQEVKLCCPHCKKDFDKNPAKYLKKIQDAATGSQK
jgi:YHS domain-containing protein